MYYNFYKKIVTTLVFIAVFSTVSPANVFANDSVEITNTVFSSSNSGNKITVSGAKGIDGQDGVSGKNGQDGQSGSNGTSIVRGKSTATAHVESSIDGIQAVDIHKVTLSETNEPAVAEVHTTTSENANFVPQIQNIASDSNNTAIAVSELNGIQQILSSIQLILLKYVSIFF